MKLAVQGVTITVSDLERSQRFYQEVLGFEPDSFYEPTRWQSYRFAGRAYFAIGEVPGYETARSKHIVNFDVWEIEDYWDRIKDHVDIEEVLTETPWGSHKFVIQDPDGNRLGFVEKRSED
jgi:catechol 2,3-dioxygenase-like lactoylglutathione lyase family enzyme